MTIETMVRPNIIQGIREVALPLETLLQEHYHYERVRKINTALPQQYINTKALKKIRSIGATWFVDSRFIEKFEYAAKVSGTYKTVITKTEDSWSYSETIYSGDIPDSVCEKARVARKLGLKYLTIHSNIPLPVTFILHDPVLIGWSSDPEIVRVIEKVTNKPISTKSNRNTIGVVLAVWDMDKEYSV